MRQPRSVDNPTSTSSQRALKNDVNALLRQLIALKGVKNFELKGSLKLNTVNISRIECSAKDKTIRITNAILFSNTKQRVGCDFAFDEILHVLNEPCNETNSTTTKLSQMLD